MDIRFVFFFFFSSRRRHTRCSRDWSSDVCSSDLVEAVEDVLSGLAERHPSRTIVLFPEPSEDDGLDGSVEVDRYAAGHGRQICTETIRLRLRGNRVQAPASVVEPLLLPDLPVFLRWRGLPPFGEQPFEQMVRTVDRLIVDSTEWPYLPEPYEPLARIFDRVVVSDIAWARTSRWRLQLASLWPGIAEVRRIQVIGTEAQAHLLAGCARGLAARSSSSTRPPTSWPASRSTASRRHFRPARRPARPTC